MIVTIRIREQFCQPFVACQCCKNTILDLRIVSVCHQITRTRFNHLCNAMWILLSVRARATHTSCSCCNLSIATENVSTRILEVLQVVEKLSHQCILLLIFRIHMNHRILRSTICISLFQQCFKFTLRNRFLALCIRIRDLQNIIEECCNLTRSCQVQRMLFISINDATKFLASNLHLTNCFIDCISVSRCISVLINFSLLTQFFIQLFLFF